MASNLLSYNSKNSFTRKESKIKRAFSFRQKKNEREESKFAGPHVKDTADYAHKCQSSKNKLENKKSEGNDSHISLENTSKVCGAEEAGKPPLPPKSFSHHRQKLKANLSLSLSTKSDGSSSITRDEANSPLKNIALNCISHPNSDDEESDGTLSTTSANKSNVPRQRTLKQNMFRSMRKDAHRSGDTSFPAVQYVRVHGTEDGAYENKTEPRGLIFMKNFEKFDNNLHDNRTGSDLDFANLLNLFRKMGYKKHKSCESGHITKKNFVKDLQMFRDLNHSVYHSTIIIIMSHGVRDKTFVTSDNEEVDLLEVYTMFNNSNCETLKNKPKIFILQFCRPLRSGLRSYSSTLSLAPLSPGRMDDINNIIENIVRIRVAQAERQLRMEFQQQITTLFQQHQNLARGRLESDTTPTNEALPQDLLQSTPPIPAILTQPPDEDENTDTSSCTSTSTDHAFCYGGGARARYLEVDARSAQLPAQDQLPDYSDMYSIFSTNSGGVAYRDPRKGSLLIQSICRVFSRHAFQDDIEELVRKVSKDMQQTLSRDDPVTSHRQAVERVNNGLDKSFYFNPFPVKEKMRSATNIW